MKYESNVLKRLIDTYGVIGNPKYMSEIIKQFIVQGKECFPHLFTYQADWLAHIDEFGLTSDYVVSYTGQQIYAPHSKEKPVKHAILKGSTKYRDIDTGEFLESFEDGRNLEFVSVKMPVLTTSNEDGTKSNILSTPSDLELRGIGDVQDTLDCLTGEVTQRIGEVVLNGSENWTLTYNTNDVRYNIYSMVLSDVDTTINNSFLNCLSDKAKTDKWSNINANFTDKTFGLLSNRQLRVQFNGTLEELKNWLLSTKPIIQYIKTKSIKTVELTIHDKDHQKVERLTTFEGGTHFTTSSQDGSLLPTLTVDVVTDLAETLNLCSLDGNTM